MLRTVNLFTFQREYDRSISSVNLSTNISQVYRRCCSKNCVHRKKNLRARIDQRFLFSFTGAVAMDRSGNRLIKEMFLLAEAIIIFAR